MFLWNCLYHWALLDCFEHGGHFTVLVRINFPWVWAVTSAQLTQQGKQILFNIRSLPPTEGFQPIKECLPCVVRHDHSREVCNAVVRWAEGGLTFNILPRRKLRLISPLCGMMDGICSFSCWFLYVRMLSRTRCLDRMEKSLFFSQSCNSYKICIKIACLVTTE